MTMPASPIEVADLAKLAQAIRDNRTWKPASEVKTGPRLERGRRQASATGRELGHVLSAWEDDTEESSVAECLVCEGLAAVDASHMQPVQLNGAVLNKPCPGPRIW